MATSCRVSRLPRRQLPVNPEQSFRQSALTRALPERQARPRTLAIGANLNATQSVLLGAPVTGTMNGNFGTSAVNINATGKQILIGRDYGVASNLVKNSSFTITSGSNTPVTFTYGGYGVSRSVTTSGSAGNGDAGNTLDTETVAAGAITNTNTQASIQVTVANPADYAMGGHISISGITAAVGGVPASQINGEQTITGKSGNVITFAACDYRHAGRDERHYCFRFKPHFCCFYRQRSQRHNGNRRFYHQRHK